MVFSSVVFLMLFLPLFLLTYRLVKGIKIKNGVLITFSLFFYAWGEPVWILALLFSAGFDYAHGLIIEKYPGAWQAKAALISSLVLNLGLLFAFKYSGFMVSNLNALFGAAIPVPRVTLPLGISFYTFQTLSYTIDVYRGQVKAQKSFAAFLSYVAMFPQLVAGPIVRYADVAARLTERMFSLPQFSEGVNRFVTGLAKKVLLANSAGTVVMFLMDGDLTRLSVLSAWLGLVMFAFQIYFDFSGYSDMAIGLGKMIGFDFKENFNYPYTARTVGDFWRRWHISLSSFIRDYVYISLGGNRRRYVRNMIICWFLTGFWHGASWNFVLWGLYFGAIILLEHAVRKWFKRKEAAKPKENTGAEEAGPETEPRIKVIKAADIKKGIHKRTRPLPRAASRFFQHLYCMTAVTLGWALFYFTDFSRLGAFFAAAFGLNGRPLSDFTFQSMFINNLFLLLLMFAASTPLSARLWARAALKYEAAGRARPLINGILFVLCFIMLVGQTYNPFLYFRF